jgi:AmiR/NasT family two-component response regulator
LKILVIEDNVEISEALSLIVIFTASSNQDLLHEIIDIGVKEVFKKPFSLDDLIKLIEKYRPRA